MKVLYIIAGIIIGIPIYILVNILLAWISRFLFALSDFLFSDSFKEAKKSFISEIQAKRGSVMSFIYSSHCRWFINTAGWIFFLVTVGVLVVSVFYSLIYVVFMTFTGIFIAIRWLFRGWLRIIKFCWNLGKKNKSTNKHL